MKKVEEQWDEQLIRELSAHFDYLEGRSRREGQNLEQTMPEDYCELCGEHHFNTLSICEECEKRVFPDVFKCSECLENLPVSEDYRNGVCSECSMKKDEEQWDEQLSRELSAHFDYLEGRSHRED